MRIRTALVLAASLSATAPAYAAEQTLEFTLVTRVNDAKEVKAPNVEGHSFSAASASGVAFFKDGRVAAKDFVIGEESANGELHDKGASTYYFTDGSTLDLTFVGAYKDGHYHGDYTVVSGTGVYAGATGSGTFDNLPTKWKASAFLFQVKLDVKTPGS